MTPDSSAISKLRKALPTQGQAAVDAFWKQVGDEGSPMVEPPDDGGDQVVLTFVWRGRPGIEAVAVAGGPAGPLPLPLQPLDGSDVWYRCFGAPPDSRFTYFYLENPDPEWLRPARGLSPSKLRMLESTLTDPLNRAVVEVIAKDESPTGREVVASVCELAEAPAEWSQPRSGVGAGVLESVWLDSEILGNRRRVSIHHAAGEPDAQGLLVAFDGGTLKRPVVNLPVVLDNLYGEGLCPPLLSVMVEQPHPLSKSRLEEFTCNQRFLQFVSEELLPWIKESSGLVPKPERTILAGMSLSGLAAGFCGVSRPDLFESVLSVAGSFWWAPDGEAPEWLARQVASGPRVAKRWYLEAGRFDTSLEAPSDILRSNRALRDALTARGAEVHLQEFSGGHDPICCGISLANGLQVLTSDW